MSSTKSNVNVKIDADIKESAIFLLGQMGLDQKTAIELFYRQIIAERRLPFQPVVNPAAKENAKEKTLDEQLTEAINSYVKRNNIPTVKLEVDENGSIIIDDRIKKEHPDIYDWAVNG